MENKIKDILCRAACLNWTTFYKDGYWDLYDNITKESLNQKLENLFSSNNISNYKIIISGDKSEDWQSYILINISIGWIESGNEIELCNQNLGIHLNTSVDF